MGRRKRTTDQLDPVRRRLLRLLDESRSTMRTASQAIERNDSYLHQFIHRGTPKVLAEDDREALAEHLGCSPDLLRHDRGFGRRGRPKPAPTPGPRRRVPTRPPEATARCRRSTRARRRVREPGTTNTSRPRDMWLFADPLIRHEFRAKPEDLQMITVDGDSMEPLLSSGDRILIDVSLPGAGAARHLRHLGRHGARRKTDRARPPLRAAQGRAQVPQPRVRKL